MKENKIITLLILSFIGIISLYIYLNQESNNKILISTKSSNQIVNTNALTMMYETEAGSGEYQVTSDTVWPQDGYTFNERLSGCENGSELIWDDENKRVIMSTSVSDKCYVYFDKMVPTFADICREENSNTLACKVATNYTTDSENGLYYHDGTGSYTNANQEAGDNSYRYAGASPNNYVCFGSDAETCPSDNLYRIIGLFNDTGEYQVKLIKYDYANSDLLGTNGAYNAPTTALGSYYKGNQSTLYKYRWNSEGGNIWSQSDLNTVNLNQNYLNNIGSEWSSKIAEHPWQVGGESLENIAGNPVQTVYNYEVGANAANTTYNAKIGLMYVSDYGYAASPIVWTLNMNGYTPATPALSNNWMHMGYYEWTISRSTSSTMVFFVHDAGMVNNNLAILDNGVRPVFYLNSTVTYISGSGTESDPFRIA